jgi:hypothetical protein
MSRNLDQAGELYRKAVRLADIISTTGMAENTTGGQKLRDSLRDTLRIAEGLTRLAAIEAGRPCCCHPAQPEEDQS